MGKVYTYKLDPSSKKGTGRYRAVPRQRFVLSLRFGGFGAICSCYCFVFPFFVFSFFFLFSLISGVSIDRVFLGTKLVMKMFLAIHVLYGKYISQVPTWVVYDLLHVGKV